MMCNTGRKFVEDSLRSLCGHGARMIRLDAYGYVTKKPGTRCFFEVRKASHPAKISLIARWHASPTKVPVVWRSEAVVKNWPGDAGAGGLGHPEGSGEDLRRVRRQVQSRFTLQDSAHHA